MMNPPTVLYIDHVAHLGGAEISLLGLVKTLHNQQKIYPSVVLPQEGALQQQFQQIGISTFVNPIKQLNVTYNPLLLASYGWGLGKYVRQLGRLIRHQKVQIIHANSIKAGLLAGVSAKLLGIPMVWHIRDFYSAGWIRWLVQKWHQWVAAYPIAISQRVAQMFSQPVEVIYNGVDVDLYERAVLENGRFSLRSHFQIAPHTKLVGMVAQLAPWKGQTMFLEVASHITQLYSNVHFAIIGDVYHDHQIPYREMLKQTAQSALPGKVSFWGWQPDVPAVMAALDVLIHPAQEEPFGRVVIEAMAASKPVVGLNSGGLPEIIENGRTGFLVATAPQMTEKTIELLQDPCLCASMGQQGHHRVQTHFSLQANAAQVLQLYQQILKP